MLNLLVLRAPNIEATRAFYAGLGFQFQLEKHGTGPQHFACEHAGFVLEIYPLKAGQTEVNDSIMLGIEVESLEKTLTVLGSGALIQSGEPRFCMLQDPDGRSVRLTEL